MSTGRADIEKPQRVAALRFLVSSHKEAREKFARLRVLRVFKNILRAALFADDAVGHKDDVRGNVARERHFVRYNDHRETVSGERAHNIEHLADHLRIERARRLVEEQHFRLHRKRAGDRHALLLSAGELRRARVDVRRHADAPEILHGGLLRFGPAAPEHRHLTGDAVLQRGHVVEEIEALEHHANLCAVLREIHFPRGDVLSVVEHLAGRRHFKKVDAPEHRALARAGSSDDAEHFTLFHAEMDIAQNGMLNYGYGLLYGKIEGALIKAGIDPYVGVMHRDDYNRPVLVYDVIEIFRVWVDYVVISLLCQNVVSEEHYSVNPDGSYWLEPLGRRMLIQSVNDYLDEVVDDRGNQRSRLTRISLYAQNLAQTFKKYA